jgi:hypothetical protein
MSTAELVRSVDKVAASEAVLPSARRVIFISHATPQDNVFSAWLAAQLAIAGYEVWCDVTQLLGGEAWWRDIDQAIDAAAFRVLFVSTLEANRKPGTLRELRLAFEAQKKHGLEDFIIPIKIDEFPFASMQETIQDLNCVRFDETWAAGLAKPWSLADIRDGVCYIGLVFKRTNNPSDNNEACCGAQMFLHTGEGIVFKGAVGAWGSDKVGEFHLSKDKAAEIVRRCLDSYTVWHGKPPKEVFIHGRTRFNPVEIEGFRSALSDSTALTGIQITKPNDLKLYREGRRPILRGLALHVDERNAFLWTMGYVPKLATYPGREVPTPLKVKIVFGETKLDQVLADILALTKLNFNACIFGDGLPVTLRFADDIGEILTAIPEVGSKPLPFRHYI